MSERTSFRIGKTAGRVGTVLLVFTVLFGSWLIFSSQISAANNQNQAANPNLGSLSRDELEKEKLRQEVIQLQFETDRLSSPWQRIASYATLITAIVAVAGVFITVWRQISDRQRDREQREAESRRRLDEKFSSIIAEMGSENPSLQVSAIVALMTFLRPQYSEFHEQVYLILLANLKIESSPQVNRLLVQAFESALKLMLQSASDPAKTFELDFTNMDLYRVNLSGLDLSNADLGFADLRLANLKEANLYRAKGIEVNLERAKLSKSNLNEVRFAKANLESAHLHDANLVAANLKEANLCGAEFYRSKLQSAHLDDSDITGARFEEANLDDAFFKGVKWNASTLKSLGKAYNWEKAHFEEGVREKIGALVRQDKNAPRPR